MRPALLVIAAVIIVLLLPASIVALNEFRMTDYEEPHNITTGAGETTANVSLSQELFNDDTALVSLSSNNTSDAPIPYLYTSATRYLLITGLVEDDTRQVTVTYKIDNLTDYVGAGVAAKVWPVFLILGIIGIVAAGVYSATRRGE